ncbi:MAG TPA: alpha/beta hydrolase [Thermoanaerobaculia bacterium]
MNRFPRPAALCALLASALLAPGCLRLRPETVPMVTRSVSEPGAPPGRCLVVFLPGRRDTLGDYRVHGFPKMAREAGVSADYLEVDAHLAYYASETITKRLRDDVIEPARAKGADRIWIVGISMGGLGGILYAREHPEIAGVVALAPFLGDTEPGLVAKAGGLPRYTPGAKRVVADYERELWGWLKEFTAAGAAHPPVYLGWGEGDDLAPADKLLGDALPPGRVFTARGKHDWRTWTDLWREFLRSGTLQRGCGGSEAAPGGRQP